MVLPKCPHCKMMIDRVQISQRCIENGFLQEGTDKFIVTHCGDREWGCAPEKGLCPYCFGEIELHEDSSFDY